MKYSSISITSELRTGIVTLARPERRNALDDTMITELASAFRRLESDGKLRMIVLTGEGSSFCAGMDIGHLRKYSKLGKAANLRDARGLMKLLRTISSLKKPVIAMVNGPALGGGLGLSAASDFCFASREKALFGAPEVRLGFLPAVILTYLIKRMGEARAREFVIAGEICDAAGAMEKGLVSELAADGKLRDTVMGFSERLSRSASPNSIAMIKGMFAGSHTLASPKGYERAAKLNALSRTSADFKKGIGSFLARKKIEW